MGSPAIPPPPAAAPSDDVTPQLGPASLGSGSRMDFVRSLINNLSGGGIPVIQERLAADFAKRQQDAENFRNQARQGTTYATHARSTVDNSVDPATGKPRAPFGINAMTGQPATAEDIQGWHNDISTGREGYLKTLPKDAKPVAQKLFDVVHHIAGHKGGPGAAPLMTPGDFGGETANPNAAPPAVPPPPQAAAGAPGPAIPPPPSGPALPPNMQDAALAMPEQQRMMGVQNALAAKKAELGQEVGSTQTTFDPASGAMGSQPVSKTGEPIGTPIKNTFPSKLLSPGMIHPVNIVGPDGQPMPALQNKWTREIYDQDGNTIPNARVFSSAILPTTKSGSSVYNADTGVTTSTSTQRKVMSGRPAAIPAPPGTGGGGGGQARGSASKGGRLESMSQGWDDGTPPSKKDQPQVQKWRQDHGLPASPAVLTGPAQTVMMKTQPVLDQVNGLLKHIDDLKLGDNNTRGYLFLPRLNYATGGASEEGSLGKDIAGLSLGSVIEAASALQGSSRSIQALKIALDHTPNAWVDSPKLMKDKLETIKARLQDVMDEANKYGRKNLPAANVARPGSIPAPPKGAPRTAEEYLQSLHAQ